MLFGSIAQSIAPDQHVRTITFLKAKISELYEIDSFGFYKWTANVWRLYDTLSD